MQPKPVETSSAAVRDAYYDDIAGQSLAPLWERLKGLVSREPQPKAKPFGWRYADVRPR